MLLPINHPSQQQGNTDSYWYDESRMNFVCLPDSSPHANKMLHAKSTISFSPPEFPQRKWHKLFFFQWTWVIWIIPRVQKQTAGNHRWGVTHWQERVAIRNGRRRGRDTLDWDTRTRLLMEQKTATGCIQLLVLFLK